MQIGFFGCNSEEMKRERLNIKDKRKNCLRENFQMYGCCNEEMLTKIGEIV